MNSAVWRFTSAAILFLFVMGAGVPLRAQDSGPMAPPPKYDANRISATPHPGPPPIPVEEIIRRFGVAEDQAQKTYTMYDFTQSIRVAELNNPDGTPGAGGNYTLTAESYVRPDGARFMRPLKSAESTLKTIRFTLEDVGTLETLPLFFMTSADTANYAFTYVGQDKLDELNTYVFQVKPKQISRQKRFFDGAIWVDDHDLAIVKTFGKFVTELSDNTTGLPFAMYETYRENFQQKYWLPTYTTSDAYMNQGKDDEMHLRLVMRSTGFKLNSLGGAPPPVSSGPIKLPDQQTDQPQQSEPDNPSVHPRIN